MKSFIEIILVLLILSTFSLLNSAGWAPVSGWVARHPGCCCRCY